MISKKTKYALKALQYLSLNESRGPIQIGELSLKERIPKKFLEAILLELNKKGILKSRKGKLGGYFLSKSPDQISLGDILRLVEGPIAPLSCLSKTAHAKCEDCEDESTCAIKSAFAPAYEAQVRILEATSLRNWLDNYRTASGALHYSI